jgi:hypothetical protein
MQMSIHREWIDTTRDSDQVADNVDQAVAEALHHVSTRKTGNDDIDAWVEQSLITLGGMVKITELSKKLDIDPVKVVLMEMNLQGYRFIIDDVSKEILK